MTRSRGPSRPGENRAGGTPPFPAQQPRTVSGVRARAHVMAAALLPLRLFLGFTFVYAGLDKLLDPSFLDPTSTTGIHAQLEAFARTSPIAPLVQVFALPFPTAMGVLISVSEIAVGLGALSGVLFRLAAVGGAALSFTFFLTASWSVHPYYLGNDLPYMMGWITLAAAGTGEVLVLEPWLAARVRSLRGGSEPAPLSPERRYFLQAVVLGGVALLVGAAAVPLGKLIHGDEGPHAGTGGGGGASNGTPTTSAPPAPGATQGSGSAPASGTGTPIAKLTDFSSTPAVSFTVPSTGDPAWLVKLPDGNVVAYDAICTHAGCPVGYDAGTGDFVCPCHGSMFDPAHGAQVLQGPAPSPLLELPLHIDSSTGVISLTG